MVSCTQQQSTLVRLRTSPARAQLKCRYICTFAVAHALYLAKERFAAQGYIPLDNLTRPFWSDLLGSAFEDGSEGFWSREKDDDRKPMDTKLFRTALTQLGEVGDRYLSVGRKFAPNGRISEQMDRWVHTRIHRWSFRFQAVAW